MEDKDIEEALVQVKNMALDAYASSNNNSGEEVLGTAVSQLCDIVEELHNRIKNKVQKHKPKKLIVINDDGTTTEVNAPQTAEEVKAFQKAVKESNEALEKFDALLEKAFGGDKDAFDKLGKQAG